ncbi:putative inositol monophosphatase 3 [Paramacrobiotus metropolitanus]|uniref:putative inositol monophosphatase 3 n=1 Tax=Paramacrobiotus metropolitanus TaxID=2943436 RepID=UPI00244627B2|nr:putative inositol monophosphatase 3 [Paramacrobiotus metropolitanus]
MGIRWSPAGVLAVMCVAFLGFYLMRETLWPLLPFSSPGPHQHSPRVSVAAVLCAAVVAAQRGGVEVRRVHEAQQLNAKNKGGNTQTRNPVTDGDLRSHFAMARTLQLAFGGGLRVVSEEHGAVEGQGEGAFPNVVVGTVDNVCPEEISSNSAANTRFVDLRELQVWIDPLDATQEYTESLLHYVTTMVGIAHKGKAIAGVIHKPFEEDPAQRTYWAWTDVAVSGNLEEVLSRDRAAAGDTSRPHKLIVSRSHTGDVEEVARVAFQGRPMEVELAGGAGYKTLQVILGRASLYLHTTLIKKWDLGAPNGLLTALGGRLTTVQGRDVDYAAPRSDADVVSHGGVVAALDGHAHYLDVLAALHPTSKAPRVDS